MTTHHAPRVLVTRPAAQARTWVDALRACGIGAHALPLIAIAPAGDLQALREVAQSLHRFDAVMFVSAAAVQGLLGDSGVAASAWTDGTRAWATGPGTVRALLQAGVPAASIDAPGADATRFDSEALWERVSAQVRSAAHAPARVLIARGGDAHGDAAGRPWLEQRLRQHGASVDTVVTYRRVLPDWSDADRALLADAAPTDWLLSSSESIRNLQELSKGVSPGLFLAHARALCTHPRIAQAAQAAGFPDVRVVPATLEGLVAFLQSAG